MISYLTLDAAPHYIRRYRVYVERNKNFGHCVSHTKLLGCWFRTTCAKKVGYRCVRTKTEKRCRYLYTRTCKVCNRWYWKTCTRYHGCKNGPLQPRHCARKVVARRYFIKTVRVVYRNKY